MDLLSLQKISLTLDQQSLLTLTLRQRSKGALRKPTKQWAHLILSGPQTKSTSILKSYFTGACSSAYCYGDTKIDHKRKKPHKS